MSGLSFRMDKDIIEELDRLATLNHVDRTSIVKRILEKGIEKERLELAMALYLQGDSIGRAVDVSQCNLWDLLEEFKKRGITKRFDLEDAKEFILASIAKNNPELQNKINELK